MLEGLDGEHALVPNHDDLSQAKNFSYAGPSQQATWSTGPTSIRHGQRLVTKPSQRTAQQQQRSSSIKNTLSSREKSVSLLGQEMRNAAQRVQTFGGQLLDIERYLESHVDQWAGSNIFCRCDRTLGEVQSEIVNLQARTSRIERSLAQVFDQMKQMEQLNKTMMEGVHAMCDGLSTLPNFTGQEGT